MKSNLEDVKRAIDLHVFDSKDPIVLSIVGGWGEGKTYFWKQFIENEHADVMVGYVSVFGAETINEIRQRVIAGALGRAAGKFSEKAGVTNYKNNRLTRYIATIIDNWHYALDKLSKKFGIPENLSTQLLEEEIFSEGFVLCIDDVERISSNFNYETFLGYINTLKEEHSLKVVLIFNDDIIGKNEAFSKYHEKVIDRQLRYKPDMAKLVCLVFNEILDSVQTNEIERRCKCLKLANMRLLNRVKHFYIDITSALPDNADKDFLHNCLNSILLYTWIKYGKKQDQLLTFDFLKKYSEMLQLILDKQDEDKEEVDIVKLLSDYGYGHTDKLDLILMEYVQTDLLNTKELISKYKEYTDDVSVSRVTNEFREVWQSFYHNSFSNNDKEFAECLISKTTEYIKYIPIDSLDVTLKTLNRLGYQKESEELFNKFKNIRGNSIGDIDRSIFGGELSYQPIINLLNEARDKSIIDNRSIKEVLDNCDDMVLSQKDRKRLAEFSTDEFFDHFISTKESHLIGTIDYLGNIANRITNPDDDLKSIQETIREVAHRISETSELNRMRIESTGLVARENDVVTEDTGN